MDWALNQRYLLLPAEKYLHCSTENHADMNYAARRSSIVLRELREERTIVTSYLKYIMIYSSTVHIVIR